MYDIKVLLKIFSFLNRDDATIICREKGMGDRKIQEVMSKLKVGGDISLDCLEELLREFPQSKDDKSVGSCSNEENLRDTSDISNDVSTTDISNTSSTQTNNMSRGTNFLELANTVSLLVCYDGVLAIRTLCVCFLWQCFSWLSTANVKWSLKCYFIGFIFDEGLYILRQSYFSIFHFIISRTSLLCH